MGYGTPRYDFKSLSDIGIQMLRQGSLKPYQLIGNFQNYLLGINQSYDNYLMPFCTPVITDVDQYISSIKLYTLNSNLLATAQTYDDYILARDSYISLSNSLAEKTTYTGYCQFIISINNILTTLLPGGFYELVITDNKGIIYESDIFSTCLVKEGSVAVVTCANANVGDESQEVEYGNYPTFSIDLTESNGVDFSYEITLRWALFRDNTFNNIVFNDFIFEDPSTSEITQVLIGTLRANTTQTITSILSEILPKGQYGLMYYSNVPGCSGTLTFSVLKDCMTYSSGSFVVNSTGGGLINVTLTIAMLNECIVITPASLYCEIIRSEDGRVVKILSLYNDVEPSEIYSFVETFYLEAGYNYSCNIYGDTEQILNL